MKSEVKIKEVKSKVRAKMKVIVNMKELTIKQRESESKSQRKLEKKSSLKSENDRKYGAVELAT